MVLTKLNRQGNSTGVVFPTQVLTDAQLERGDSVRLDVVRPGAVMVTKHSSAHDAYSQAIDWAFDRYGQTLADLAK